MSNLDDLIRSEVEASEQADDFGDVDTPLPSHVKVTRGHDRAKVLQVRLNEDELRVLTKLADERHLPVSTFVRSILLQRIGY